MKIGDSVYVRGVVDEIRKDVVIISNSGGYFGTAIEDIVPTERKGRWVVLPPNIENQSFDECKCSECQCVEYFNVGWKKFSYCPNCGARMEQSDDSL